MPSNVSTFAGRLKAIGPGNSQPTPSVARSLQLQFDSIHCLGTVGLPDATTIRNDPDPSVCDPSRQLTTNTVPRRLLHLLTSHFSIALPPMSKAAIDDAFRLCPDLPLCQMTSAGCILPHMPNKPETTFVQPGRVLRTLPEAEAAALTSAWLQVFRPHREGTNVKRYLWHVFSTSGYQSLSGKAALAAYATREAPEYLVLSNDQRFAFATDQRPDKIDLSDCLVFPPNLAWTMAFTHEDGWLGPYFATHPDVDRLDAANLAQMRKRRELDAASAKGWA